MLFNFFKKKNKKSILLGTDSSKFRNYETRTDDDNLLLGTVVLSELVSLSADNSTISDNSDSFSGGDFGGGGASGDFSSDCSDCGGSSD